MIKILIIEDEIPARNKIKRFLAEIDAPVEVCTEINTVEKSISFLQINVVDLIFSDIKLLDGNSFEIYTQVSINCPIIFTTAYDHFLMNAFETNGIAYLLKPFSKGNFQRAWDKFLLFRREPVNQNVIANFAAILEEKFAQNYYKKRITISNHKNIYFLETENIFYLEANEGVIFAFDGLGKKHLLNESTLKEIEIFLNPIEFFRINRSELVNKKYIEKIERYSKNSLLIHLKNVEKKFQTSQSNTSSFREWVEK